MIGSGAIQTAVWIPEVGVAACSNRSKVMLWVKLMFFQFFFTKRNAIYLSLFFLSSPPLFFFFLEICRKKYLSNSVIFSRHIVFVFNYHLTLKRLGFVIVSHVNFGGRGGILLSQWL